MNQTNPRYHDADVANLMSGLAVGIGTAVVFGVGGFFLISDRETGAMGAVLFFLLPLATGLATGLVARRLNILIVSLIIGFLICCAVLLATKQEGFVCVLMSAPIIMVGLGIGALFGLLIKYLINKSSQPPVLNLLVLFILPFFLMGANSIEKPSRRIPRSETFTSVLVIDASPEKVWNSIKTMDRVTAQKGFLMRIGLPVPVSCKVDKEVVGGTRTCYFESGYIEERITEWEPPRSMKLEITAWDVPGRPWLDFKDASYELHEENGRTVMTRSSTIVSRLLPASYWRPFERIGVETEHEYLFEAVRNRINAEK